MATKKDGKRNKHLTPEDRSTIETGLNMGMTFKGIARKIGKDPTTVSYEVKHHRMIHKNGFSTEEQPCPMLLKAPFVCNNCPVKSSAKCRHTRYLYRSNVAQKEYKELLSTAREGIPLNQVQFYIEDQIITDGLKRGQHIYHIMASHPEVRSSKSTVYRHFHSGYYSASVLDLPRAVKFKPRHKKPSLYVPSRIKAGRTWADFSALLDEKQLSSYVELDTVIGREGGKVIMTIHFTESNFMAGLLLDNKTACEAAAKFSALKDKLRSNGFRISDIMPVMLTDNGGEFSDVFAF